MIDYNECSPFVHVRKVRINYGIRTALKRKIPSWDSHVASPGFFDRKVWLILLFPRLIKLMSGILPDVGTSIKTRDTNMIKIQISNRRTKLCCVGIRESHPSFYPPPPETSVPLFLVAPPNKTPLYSEVSKTTNIRYNKYNHTAWLVYRTLISFQRVFKFHALVNSFMK